MDTRQIDEKAIFNAARQIADAAAREDFLAKAYASDESAIEHIRALLHVHDQAPSFLESPVPGLEEDATIIQPIAVRLGATIGPYKLLQQIGEGGMGVVFMAEQTKPIQRIVALKIIKPGMDTRQVVARFEAERQALALMDHPNIARVLDAGTTGEGAREEDRGSSEEATSNLAPCSSFLAPTTGRPYFVMDLVKGVPITKFCDEKHFSLRERLELLLPVCQAVQHAHQKGIIHRDIKPTNVLVADYDGRPVPKVIDFGVAKATAQKLSERTMFTEFGQVIGTIEYMSPEQATFNQLDVDTRSDVYSLGVLLYELLTGSTPFERQRLRDAAFDEMLRIIREEDPPKPSTRLNASDTLPAIAANRHSEPARLSKDVSGELDWIVMRALEKDRNRRYQTANALAEDVQRYLLDQPVTACPPSASYRFRKFIRRNKAGATLAAAVLSFLVLTGGGIGWAVRDRAAREAFFARVQADRQVALEKGVRAALDDVKEWHRRENWTDAAAAVKRAEGLLAAGTAQPELERSVKEWRTDLDTVARLEEIRLVYQTNERLSLDARPAALADYQQEFRSIGIDIDALSSDEAAARIRARPIGKQLIAALEDWTQVRHMPARAEGQLQPTDTPAWQQRPLVVARAADDDEFCNRVRDAWLASGPTEIAALARLPEVMNLPPSTLDLLDRRVKDRDVAIELLTRAHYAHAEDFRINLLLASRLLDVEGADVRKLYKRKELRPPAQIAVPAVAYANAAVALQPDNPWAWLVLGQALEHAGRLEESNIAHRKSIDLKPEFFGAYNELSRNLYQLGELDASLAAAKRAIELNPKIPGTHVNKSIVLYEQGQIDEAIAAVREAIRIDPKFSPAHGNLGTFLCELRQYDEAIAEFQLALKLHPDDADDYSSLGRALTRRGGVGDLDDAIAACQKAIELAPDHAVAYSNLGIALRAEGKLSDAVSALHKATELRPDDATAYCELGVTLRQLGRIDEAIEAHRKAINIDPEIPCSYINLGAILFDRKEFEAALKVFRTVAHLKPKDATSHSNLGITLKELGRFDEAISECRIAIELEPDSAAAHRSLGNVLRANSQFEAAIVEFNRAIELQRDYVEAYCDLGEALEDHGQVKEAIDASRKAIELDPKCVSAYNNLASALLTLERTDEAEAALRKAIELDSKQAVTHSNLSTILLSRGRLDEAIVELQKSVELEPDIDVYRDLATALSNTGRFPEAIDAYRKIVALKPDDASAYSDLGGHLQAVGQFKEAIEVCQKAIQLQPTSGDAHNNLGNAFKKSKRLDEALAEYRIAAKLAPEYPGVAINIAQTLDTLGKHDEAAEAYRKALKLKLDDAAMCNGVAWTMATSPTPEDRHPAEAVAFAKRATELAPHEGSVWNTLGVARYRNAEWQQAIEALQKSMELRAGGDSSDWFFLATAYWQIGDKDKARTWYEKAAKWMEQNAANDKELHRFGAEAAKLLGIAETPATNSN